MHVKAQAGPETQRGRGRPRNQERDVQIRATAWKLIAETGCAGLTFEAIAQKTGCSRSTLYRRFANKADLILHLLDGTAHSVAPDIETHNEPRALLMAHIRTLVELYSGYRGIAFIHIFAASRSDPAIASALDAHIGLVVPHYVEPMKALVPEAQTVALTFAVRTLIGSVLYHTALRGLPPTEAELVLLVEAAMMLAREGR